MKGCPLKDICPIFKEAEEGSLIYEECMKDWIYCPYYIICSESSNPRECLKCYCMAISDEDKIQCDLKYRTAKGRR